MQIQWAILARDAGQDQGQWYAKEIFYVVWSSAVPTSVPDSKILFRFVADPLDRGSEFHLSLKVVNPDGHERVIGSGTMEVGPEGDGGSTAHLAVVPIARLEFEEFGRYELHLDLDGHTAASIDLTVLQSGTGDETAG